MPFVPTNPHDRHEGHLESDWSGCHATSPTFRMKLGPFPFDGWDAVARREQMRTVVEYFCPDHATVARAHRERPRG